MSSSHSVRWLVLLVVGVLAAIGCTADTQQDETGALALDLVVADDVVIDTVVWQITGNDMDMSDTINTSAPGSTASVEVFGLPKGEDEDYTITLEATSVDGEVTCAGDEQFNVEPGETTHVMVMLQCKLPRRLGAVRVNGKFNICAELVKAVVSPLVTSVGNDIDLSAQAVDADNDPITYSWTGTGGSIADPNAASTTYTCQEVGDHEVTISVTDNDVDCNMAQWTIRVTCVDDGGMGGAGGTGGTGGVGGSGACEPTEEVCDGLDNDCDDEVDEDDVCVSPSPECEGSVCGSFAACSLPNACITPVCATNTEGGGVCVEGQTPCDGLPDCTTSADCGPGGQCLKDTCCERNICATPATFCLTNSGVSSLKAPAAAVDGPTLASPE